jgi:AcrR family transcriptional regulator
MAGWSGPGRPAPFALLGSLPVHLGNEFTLASSSASPSRRSGRGPSSRSKRDEILATATEYFGKQGYEYTKWADVAEAVGVGSTALYHYFESKLHCLYEIQAGALAADREKFDRVTSEHEDFAEALKAVLDATFDLTEHEVLRNRVLVAEQSLVGLHRTSAREEEARELARSRMRDTEFAWATFLTRGMEQGAIPEADPLLLARAILGLYTSVWHWYRPRRGLELAEVRDFFVARCLLVAGLPPADAAPQPAKRRPAKRQPAKSRKAA